MSPYIFPGGVPKGTAMGAFWGRMAATKRIIAM